MDKEEITEKAQELTIKNVTDGKNKYFSWGFYKGCVVALEYNNKRIAELKAQIEKMKANVELARDNANKTENWETFSVLNSILDDWEIKEK